MQDIFSSSYGALNVSTVLQTQTYKIYTWSESYCINRQTYKEVYFTMSGHMRLLIFYLVLSCVCCSSSDRPSVAHNSAKSDYTHAIPLSTERVFYRFYLLQRLKPATNLFLKIINEKSLHDTGSLERICALQESQMALFVHPLIQKNIWHMCSHKDTKALISLIATVSQYRQINDDQYVKEVVVLLLIVYENLIKTFADKSELKLENNNARSAPLEPSDVATDMAETTSLETLLNTLDEVSEELEQLYQAKETTTPFLWKPFATIITLTGTAVWLWYATT